MVASAQGFQGGRRRVAFASGREGRIPIFPNRFVPQAANGCRHFVGSARVGNLELLGCP